MSQNTSKSSTGSSEFITGLHTSSPALFLPCSPCLSPLSLHLCSVLYICPLPPLWLSLSVPAPGHSSSGFALDSSLKWEPGLRPPDFPQTGSGCLGAHTLDGFLPEGGHLQEKYLIKGRHEQPLSCFLLRFRRPDPKEPVHSKRIPSWSPAME
uniref:Uncharacterized protein n=1 Tax=Pipistrellus kuhlii TaxID=59472 RepID=A0A7J7VVJ1_PIPKU|nr:hypothetical protein mPipKuh1_008310 [Pipistrellus kuhlii]